MKSSPASGPPVTVGTLVRRRLREIDRTVDDLAAALEVPPEYIEEIIAGVRQPVLGRTDIYARMTSFLRFGRNDLANCIPTEDEGTTRASGPGLQVRQLLLALCETKTAEQLEQRRARHGGAELAGLCRRLLDIAQGAVRRMLDDQAQLRLAAVACGRTYPAMRLHVLDFLDATSSTVTTRALNEFLAPRVARWDVELETGVLRVVMRTSDRRRMPKGRGLASPAASHGEPEQD